MSSGSVFIWLSLLPFQFSVPPHDRETSGQKGSKNLSRVMCGMKNPACDLT